MQLCRVCASRAYSCTLLQAFITHQDDKKRRNSTGSRGWETIHRKFLELATKKFVAPEQLKFVARFLVPESEHVVSVSSVHNRWKNQGIKGTVYCAVIDILCFKCVPCRCRGVLRSAQTNDSERVRVWRGCTLRRIHAITE